MVILKESPTTRVGIALWHDLPQRAIVHTVAKGMPAAEPADDGSGPKLSPFEELLTINGVPCESAIHAVTMIRNAEEQIVIRKLACPKRLQDACRKVQASWRGALKQRLGLERRELEKPTQNTLLGISFSPDLRFASVIKGVNPAGPAMGVLTEGDRVLRINGEACDEPASAAKLLRAASGAIEVIVQPARLVDIRALLVREGAAPPEDDDEYDEEGEEGEDEGEEDDDEGEQYEDGEEGYYSDEDSVTAGIPRPAPVVAPEVRRALPIEGQESPRLAGALVGSALRAGRGKGPAGGCGACAPCLRPPDA